jgi:hypothetical protein
VAEEAEVPDVSFPLGFWVAVCEAHSVNAEAGEAHVVTIPDAVELCEVELDDRPHLRGAQPVDPRAHPAGHHAHLIGCPAADQVEELQAHELGEATQAEYSAVDGLTHARCPGAERLSTWTALCSPDLGVRHAQPVLGCRRATVATGCGAWAEIGQRHGSGEERLEGTTLSALLPPVDAVGLAQLKATCGGSRAALPVRTRDHTGLVGAPAPAEDCRAAAGHPHVEIVERRGVELAPVPEAEQVRPVAVTRAPLDHAAKEAAQSTTGERQEQLARFVPLACEPAVPDEAEEPLGAPVDRFCCRRRDDDRELGTHAHEPASLARRWPSTAARMSAQRACR